MLKFKYKFLFLILIIVMQCSANIITTINQIDKRAEFIDHNLSNIKIVEYKDVDFTQYDNILPYIESTLFMGLATVNLKKYIYKNKTIKVDVLLEGRIAVVNAQYYYQDKQPFYIFQKKSYFTKEHIKTNRIEFNKYYIKNNKLIQWVYNDKMQTVGTTTFLLEEKRILRDANIYLNIRDVNEKGKMNIIAYNTPEFKEYVQNAPISLDKAWKIQLEYMKKHSENDFAYNFYASNVLLFFIVDDYYIFTMGHINNKKLENISLSGIWVNTKTGEVFENKLSKTIHVEHPIGWRRN